MDSDGKSPEADGMFWANLNWKYPKERSRNQSFIVRRKEDKTAKKKTPASDSGNVECQEARKRTVVVQRSPLTTAIKYVTCIQANKMTRQIEIE